MRTYTRRITLFCSSLLGLSLLVLPLGCDDDGDDDDAAGDLAPAGLANCTVQTVSDDSSANNTWTFPDGNGDTGNAMLSGQPFLFRYEKNGATTSELELEYPGVEHFDMVWTSATGGTLDRTYNGTDAWTGTFTYTAQ